MPTTMQNDYDKLKKVLVRHARDAYVSQEKIEREWKALNFLEAPDFAQACRDSDAFINLLKKQGAEVVQLPADPRLTIDAIYARDAALVCDKGVILANMGKANRLQEPDVLAEFLAANNIPLAGRINGSGKIEGGDVAWVDENTLAVARGYRTNAEGIRQLRAIVGPAVEVVPVPLPHWNGPADVLHLMSFFSPIGERCAVIYSRLMPVPFRELLLEKNYQLIEVPDAEYDSLGCNVLAIAPKVVLIAASNPQVVAAMKNAGYEVMEYEGRDISWKGSGGPTCLTRPLWRTAARNI